MEKCNVVNQINHHIIPFAFSDEYSKVLGKFNSPDWKSDNLCKEKVFEHIKTLVSTDNSESVIGKRFILNNDGNTREKYGLPKNTSGCILMNIKNKGKYIFSIKSVQVFLFETNIGFLNLEIEWNCNNKNDDENSEDKKESENPAEKIVNGNYFLKKFNQSNINFVSYNSNENSQNSNSEVKISSIVDKLLENINVKTFFTNKQKPDNSVVFSSIILSKQIDEDNLKRLLFKMRRSFKDSYKPSPQEYDLNSNKEILQLFENSYWGVALEGVANIAYCVNDKETNDFITGNYIGNIRSIYFYMYILALHKRYALLHMSICVSELPKSIDDYLEEKVSLKLDQIKEKIVLFKLRCQFSDLTNVSHHNMLYDLMESSLRIKGLNEELESEISLLASITDMKAAKNKEKFNDFIVIVTIIFTTVTTIAASNDLITIITSALQHNFISIYSIVPLLLVLICIIVAKKLMSYIKQP